MVLRMMVNELRPGLWRWTAPHPDWRPRFGQVPDGWDQMVGCVYYEAPDAVVLIDPLVPPEGTSDHDRFWRALDYDVQRLDRPVAVLLGNASHERSAQVTYDRYHDRHAATLWCHAAAVDQVSCRPIQGFLPGDALPGGLHVHAVEGLGPDEGEVLYYLLPPRALVAADALIGTGEGRLRVCPPTWGVPAGEAAQARYRDRFRPSLDRLLILPIDLVLVSHGPPVLEHGHQALEDALAAPPWGS